MRRPAIVECKGLRIALGKSRELTAFAVSQRDRIPLKGTGKLIAKDTPDQLVVNGIVGGRSAEGAVVSSRSGAA